MKCSVAFGNISSKRLAFSNSAVKIPDAQAYKIYENDTRMPLFHLWYKRYIVISPNWLPLCRSCSGLCNPWETSVLSHDVKQLPHGKVPASVPLPWSSLDTTGAGQDTMVLNSCWVDDILLSLLAVSETELLHVLVGVCSSISVCMHACLRLSEFVRAITSTFINGFQKNLAQLLSLRSRSTLWNIFSGRLKVMKIK